MPWELVYEDGIYIYMLLWGSLMILDEEELDEFALTICERPFVLQTTEILLTSPLSSINDLPLEIIDPYNDRDLARFMDDQIVEDTFGMSKDAVMQHFLASDHACLTTR